MRLNAVSFQSNTPVFCQPGIALRKFLAHISEINAALGVDGHAVGAAMAHGGVVKAMLILQAGEPADRKFIVLERRHGPEGESLPVG